MADRAQGRRPARARHRDRPAHHRGAPGADRGLHRVGSGRGRRDRGRWWPARAPGEGLVRRADADRRRARRHDGRAGGDLRAGDRGRAVRRRRRGHRDRQRHRVRALRLRLQRGPGARDGARRRRMRAGNVGINTVQRNQETPFGGTKHSRASAATAGRSASTRTPSSSPSSGPPEPDDGVRDLPLGARADQPSRTHSGGSSTSGCSTRSRSRSTGDRAGFKYWLVHRAPLPRGVLRTSRRTRCSWATSPARTERIHLGSGIFNLTPPVNHPARVAERVAMLDHLSERPLRARRRSRLVEHRVPGLRHPRRRRHPRPLRRGAARGRAHAHDRSVRRTTAGRSRCRRAPSCPRPCTVPHPPLWLACGSPSTFEKAGRLGMGALCFTMGDPEDLAAADRDVPATRSTSATSRSART